MKTERAGAGGRELPEAFVEEMEALFGRLPGVSVAELPAFFKSLQGERSFGLRRNPLKYAKEEFEEKMPFSLTPVPWAEEGYFYRREEQPGKSPYHEAGAFYMQEPSAMIVAELLGAKPGERILDLCAAPGGKSTHIAGKMRGEGLLVCNEYVPARAGILNRNLERMGVRNCVILSESAERLALRFPLFFDRVLVDAPCSGEGMFRKEEQALLQWSTENVAMCAERQKEILAEAAKCLRPGGVLVYSTCTFSEAEDETVIREFLEEHGEFQADETVFTEILEKAGVCPGALPGTVRMWPHKLRGEGHFVARLIKGGGSGMSGGQAVSASAEEMPEGQIAPAEEMPGRQAALLPAGEASCRQRHFPKGKRADSRPRENAKQSSGRDAEKYFQDFCRQYLRQEYRDELEKNGTLVWKKECLFLVPENMPNLGGLRVERGGLFLGEAKKGRFEPAHTWAMTLKKENVLQAVEAEEPTAYLRGESFADNGHSGWVLVLFQGKPLGWGKAGGNTVKNHYPKGLRICF